MAETSAPNLRVKIGRLSHMAEGIAVVNGQTQFVSRTCPDEEVEIKLHHGKATLERVITASPQRKPADCIHYHACGGCSLQHLNEAAYNTFKRDVVRDKLRELDCDDAVLQPTIKGAYHTRRRAEFKLVKQKGTLLLGFYQAQSHQIVDIEQCLTIAPLMLEAIHALKPYLLTLKKPARIESISVTHLPNGLDVNMHVKQPLLPQDREKLTAHAAAQKWVRLIEQFSEDNIVTPLYDTNQASIHFGDSRVDLPPNAFLQATAHGQEAITQLVLDYLRDARHVVDLYAGCGTYSFALMAEGKTISAYEGENAMVAAFHNALHRNNLDMQHHVHCRDLYLNPLTIKELMPYDAVVINPPRNGALPQVKQLAHSEANRIVMVSCNPQTFARDAQHLIQYGFALASVTPIDQFYQTPHLELVACFEKLPLLFHP